MRIERGETSTSTTTTTINEDYQQQLKNLSLALQQKEVESKGLKQALRVLQAANKKKTSLFPDLESELASTKEELSRTHHQLEKQTETAIRLQHQVLRQQEEMRSLKEEHQDCLRKLVALEIDLETHDIHFTEYSEQQRRLEQNAMKEVFSKENNNTSVASSRGDQKQPAQELIAKLMSDHTLLEERYKRDGAKNAQRIRDLEQKNESLLASISVLEERMASNNKNVKFSLTIDCSKHLSANSAYRHRINDLEKTNARLLLRYNETKQRLDDIQNRQASNRPTGNHSIHTGRNGVASPEHQLAICKEQMAVLRTKAITYQLQTFEGNLTGSTKHGKGDPYASSGSETLSAAGSSSNDEEGLSSQGSSGAAAMSIRDLKELLKRKDRDLERQREKSHAREKELLAQLQEVYKASKQSLSPQNNRYFL
jgi:hypothetical protein